MFSKKMRSYFLVALAAVLTAGCATTSATNTRQEEMDAMNAKIAALQGQLSEKDAEIARLSNQMKEGEAARAQAEADKRRLTEKLDSAMIDLEAAKAKKAAKPAPSDADLK